MPSPKRNEVEGYLTQRGPLSIPILIEDPHNAYNSIPTV
jgi:hypothetical protein